MGVWGQFVTRRLCCTFLLRGSTEYSSRSSPPAQERVLHKLLQHVSFPQAAILCELLQCGSLPQGPVLQEQAAALWVSHTVISPARKFALKQASHWVTAFFQASTCSRVGFLHGLQVEVFSSKDLHGLQGQSCLTMVFITRISALVPGPLPPPSLLTSVLAGLFLSSILTPLSSCTWCCTGFFSLFPNT